MKKLENKLVELGGSVWERGEYKRIYANPEILKAVFGLEVEYYGSGNLKNVTMNGEWLSNGKARKMDLGNVFYNCITGKWNLDLPIILEIEEEKEEPMPTNFKIEKEGSYVEVELYTDSFEDANGDDQQIKYWVIEMLFTPEDKRQNGIGRRMMQKAINKCRDLNPDIDIRLVCEPQGDGVDGQKLAEFYESMGFKSMNCDAAVMKL